MLKVYLDNCCYNRPFDDNSKYIIKRETNAIIDILERNIALELEIYKSMALEFEISRIENINKKAQVEDLYDSIDGKMIIYNKEIRNIAEKIKIYNIKDMDALHIAFAEYAELDYLITTDKLLIKAASRAKLNIKVINPTDFIMEVDKMYNKPVTNKKLEQIRKRGLKALRDKLGPIGMIKFLQMYSNGEGDYTKEKYDMLQEESLEDFEEYNNNQ